MDLLDNGDDNYDMEIVTDTRMDTGSDPHPRSMINSSFQSQQTPPPVGQVNIPNAPQKNPPNQVLARGQLAPRRLEF